MYKRFLIISLLASSILQAYNEGDTITADDLDLLVNFSYCYPSDSINATFSFKNYLNKILVLDFSATW